MTTVVSGSSQSHKGDLKLENWSNIFIRSSSSVVSLIGSFLSGYFSFAIILSITSFTVVLMTFDSHLGWSISS